MINQHAEPLLEGRELARWRGSAVGRDAAVTDAVSRGSFFVVSVTGSGPEHRLEPHIPVHVLPCWLALLLREAERRTRRTRPPMSRELGRLHAGSSSDTHVRSSAHGSGCRVDLLIADLGETRRVALTTWRK